ncbi:MAG: hypothetical protein ACYDAE_25925 [Steroidobacteraceae bacterium]
MNPEDALALWRAEDAKVRERVALTAGYARAERRHPLSVMTILMMMGAPLE